MDIQTPYGTYNWIANSSKKKKKGLLPSFMFLSTFTQKQKTEWGEKEGTEKYTLRDIICIKFENKKIQ